MFDPTVTGSPERQRRARPLLRTMVGDVLRRTRLEQGRTLADVARAARISMPYLSELERGRKEASSEILAAVCDALRIELSDLLASVEIDLVGERLRQRKVIRLDAIRARRAPMRGGGGPDARAAGEQAPGVHAPGERAPDERGLDEHALGVRGPGEHTPSEHTPAAHMLLEHLPAEYELGENALGENAPGMRWPRHLGSGDVVCRLAA